jgi:hypothetical protein
MKFLDSDLHNITPRRPTEFCTLWEGLYIVRFIRYSKNWIRPKIFKIKLFGYTCKN